MYELYKAFEYLKEVQREFRKNSDRGVAVIASSFLNEILQAILCAFLIEDTQNDKTIFKGNGALSTFGSKIDLSHRLGLISKYERKTLHAIRGIRNKFAHQLGNISFQERSIKARCANIKVPSYMLTPEEIPLPRENGEIPPVKLVQADENNPREVFQEATIHMMHLLSGRCSEAIMHSRKPPEDYKCATAPMEKMITYLEQLRQEEARLRQKHIDLAPALDKSVKVTKESVEEKKRLDVLIKVAKYSIDRTNEARQLRKS